MIYEVRTYRVRPHSVGEVERRLGEAYPDRSRFSPLAASFHSEIGPLNQVIQVWPYQDLAEREEVFSAVAGAGGWPPEIGDLITAESAEIFVPFAVSPEIRPGEMGPFFELRLYTYADGDLPKIVEAWEAALPERLKWGPLVVVCSAEVGGVNKLLHIWPYKSLDDRWELRKRVRETGMWPPLAAARKLGLPTYKLLHQENRIVMPSFFSPLQ